MTQALNKEPKPREISDRVNQILKGALNNTGSVTLAANVTTTTVLNPNIHVDSKITLTAQTANAATAVSTSYILAASITDGQFIITHANTATVDRTFLYTYLG